MCDEAKLKEWAKEALSRRQFGALAGAAAVVACSAPSDVIDGGVVGENGKLNVDESDQTIETDDGSMDAVLVAPMERKHPAVIMWPDIASIRQSKIDMARRLAGEGYAVLIANPYYRDVPKNQFDDFASFIEADGFNKVRPWRDKLTAEAIMRDTAAIVAWLDGREEIDTARGIGAEGYCMGGPFTVYSAHAVPDRVKAAASFHGGGLVRDDMSSPHKLLVGTSANYLFAIAQDDDADRPEDKATLAAAASEAGQPAKVEVYGGDHGWTVLDSPAYAEAPAEQAYADKLELYAAAL